MRWSRKRDAVRTAFVALSGIPPILAKLALSPVFPQPSTNTTEGLRKVGADFGSVLRRLGVIDQGLAVVSTGKDLMEKDRVAMEGEHSDGEHMADDMGMTRVRVTQLIGELEEAGLVTIQRRGQGKTNLYKIHFQVRSKVGSFPQSTSRSKLAYIKK